MERSKGALCLKLFLKFLKIGAFTFGGGYAMIPLIRREIALREGWIEDKDILDILAVSESTPGPIAVNTATFVGYRVAGPLGAACATVGVVLPSFVIILLVAKFYQAFQTNTLVKGCMNGLRPTVVGMIGASLLSVGASAFPAAGGVMQWVLAAVLLSAIPLGFFDDKKICKEVRQELRERPRYWKWAIVIYWTVIAALVVAVNVIYPLVTPSM